MKIIHTADLHLGSSFTRFDSTISNNRNLDLTTSFMSLIDYANRNDVKVIMLSGDVFDNNRPLKRDKVFLYNLIESNPQIDFLYLKGNHDTLESYERSDLPNLKLFSEEWMQYVYDDVVISGIEINEKNQMTMYEELQLPSKTYNIVMLHGQIVDSRSVSSGTINLPLLKNKNIDYLALGHIHSYSSAKLDQRGTYVYSGCLEGRGFDECGEKGFVIIDTEKKTHEFVVGSGKQIFDLKVDLTNTTSESEAISKVNENINSIDGSSMVRISLVGRISYDSDNLCERVKKRFEKNFFYFEVKNRTLKIYNQNDYLYDKSLRGEFVRTVLSSDKTEEEKASIIALGFKVLDGEEV